MTRTEVLKSMRPQRKAARYMNRMMGQVRNSLHEDMNTYLTKATNALTKTAMAVLLTILALSFRPTSSQAACVEVSFSTCVGDFASGGDNETGGRLLGNASGYYLAFIQDNFVRILISSGDSKNYDYTASTPNRSGFVGIWYDGVNQWPDYHLDVNGILRSTSSAYLRTSNGFVVVGGTNAGRGAVFSVTEGSSSFKNVWGDSSTWFVVVATGGFYGDGSNLTGVLTFATTAFVPISSAPTAGVINIPTGTIHNLNTDIFTVGVSTMRTTALGEVIVGTGAVAIRAALSIQRPDAHSGPMLTITTGTKKMMEVTGSSMTIGGPIYFPDGTWFVSTAALQSPASTSVTEASSFTKTIYGKFGVVQVSTTQGTASGYIRNFGYSTWTITAVTFSVFDTSTDAANSLQLGLYTSTETGTTHVVQTEVFRDTITANVQITTTAVVNITVNPGTTLYFEIPAIPAGTLPTNPQAHIEGYLKRRT